MVDLGTSHPLNVRIAKKGVIDHEQENNQAKGSVTKHISPGSKYVPTISLLSNQTKTLTTCINRDIPQLQQNEMRQAYREKHGG